MAYNKNNFRKIKEEYATKHLVAENAADLRRAEVHAAIPEVAKIDARLAGTGLALMGAALADKAERESRFASLKAENEALNAERDRLLVAAGYPADYTDVKYDCPACSDSGYVGIKMCDCMKRALTLAGFESSGIGALLEKQTFDNFSLDFYADKPEAHRAMSGLFSFAKDYAENFDAERSENLLMMGGTGLGKTHLSSAIARRVIEGGFDVFYVTAINMVSDFEAEQFGNHRGVRGEFTDKYFECDLLILDDLGTELTNQFTVSCLYNVLNMRINRHLPTIISTNLMQNELMGKYSERITSRLFGEFRILPFLGTDIRLQKLRK